jgi:hypothetical protein
MVVMENFPLQERKKVIVDENNNHDSFNYD